MPPAPRKRSAIFIACLYRRFYGTVYAEKLAQLVEAKVQGKQLVAPPSSEPPMVVNLLEALKASVAQAGGSGSRKASKALARQLSGNGKPARKTGAKRPARRKTRKKKIA